jgi:hypothetical protein
MGSGWSRLCQLAFDAPAPEQKRLARRIPDATPSDPAENQRIVGTDTDTGKKPTPKISAGVPTGGQISQITGTPSGFQRRVKKRKRPGLVESWDATATERAYPLFLKKRTAT